MKVVCITGGIGSGKSVVCRIFQEIGIPVYEADKAVHAIYENHPELIQRISKEISEEALDKNGKINRKKLGEIVFSDSQKLKTLNSIVHPVVKNDFEKWLSSHKGRQYVVKEAAILFESGSSAGCNKIISVVSPLDLRIARIKERDHKSKAEIELIISKQMSDEERINKSDIVIINDEKQLLLPQVLKIHSSLQSD